MLGIVTSLRAGCPRNRISISGSGKRFVYAPEQTDSGALLAFYSSRQREIFSGKRAARLDAGHFPPSSADIKNKWS